MFYALTSKKKCVKTPNALMLNNKRRKDYNNEQRQMILNQLYGP